MALVQADRVKETSSTTGTGNFTLSGASTGFRSFADGVGVSNTCYYVITDDSSYEVGLGTLNASATLARTTIITSSNSNAAVDWGAGSKNVFTTYPGPKAVILDSNDELNLASALGVAGNVSVGGTFSISGNASVGGTFTISDNVTIKTQKELRLEDETGGEYVAFKAPTAVGSSVTFTFPSADGTSGQGIITDGSGKLSFGAAGVTTGKAIAMAIVFG